MARVAIVELREKVELLKKHPDLMASNRDTSKQPDDPEICAWIQKRAAAPSALHPSDLSRCKSLQELPAEHARSFLIAFFSPMNRPADLDPKADLGQRWLDALKESADAFGAVLRLRGGRCGGLAEGARWDEFFNPKRHRADEVGQDRIELIRLRHQRPRASKGDDRLLPPGAPHPFPESADPDEIVYEGDQIAFRISLQQVLKGNSRFCHFMAVQEVEDAGKRKFLPLVPYPAPYGQMMPATHLPASCVSIPADPTLHALTVPPKMGRQRRVIVIVSASPIDLEGMPKDASDNAELQDSFMDLLAARLSKPGMIFSLMRFEYQVWPKRR
ncbi:hypothetical protein ACG04Q_21505 [Roseateles sp. DXS20W]|uniref:DUF4384 domain-containing protein n=1 Tax=Pelomonas lactea TaxID=3299030 RepID=A0ABW7GR16_9BURK